MSTHEDLGVILNNLKKSETNGGSYEFHWIEDLEDHKYQKRRLIEELESIDVHLAKKNKEIYSGQEVSTHRTEGSTH